MEYWWLYLLVFIFGYVTHKTFYFLRSVKISIGMIRVSQLISLAVLAKSMENFYHAHLARLRQMRENSDSEKDIKDVRCSFNSEISIYKEKAIKEMLDLHPSAYTPIIDFDNWKSAMKYLEDNKQYVISLLTQDKDDKKTS
jgi:hypothetical protein